MLRRAADAIGEGRNQYPPGPGLPACARRSPRDRLDALRQAYDPAPRCAVTVGATEAISAAVLALVEPGDEVVVLEPWYDSYAAAVALAGGRLVPVALRPGRRRFAPRRRRAARPRSRPRTRLLLLNSPHNPTGTVLTGGARRGSPRCAGADLVAVTDEVYEHLTFDGAVHRPLAIVRVGCASAPSSSRSAGKTFSVTGWKTGWVCGPAELVRAVLTVKSRGSSS